MLQRTGPTSRKAHVAEVTSSSQEKFLTSISTFSLSASPGAFMDPLSRRSVHCKDMPGSVLSLALVSKVVVEIQARFNKGPKTLKDPTAEWRWQHS